MSLVPSASAKAGQPWKGNVRELRNVVERLLILAPGEEVGEADVAAVAGGGRIELAANWLTSLGSARPLPMSATTGTGSVASWSTGVSSTNPAIR